MCFVSFEYVTVSLEVMERHRQQLVIVFLQSKSLLVEQQFWYRFPFLLITRGRYFVHFWVRLLGLHRLQQRVGRRSRYAVQSGILCWQSCVTNIVWRVPCCSCYGLVCIINNSIDTDPDTEMKSFGQSQHVHMAGRSNQNSGKKKLCPVLSSGNT